VAVISRIGAEQTALPLTHFSKLAFLLPARIALMKS